MESQALTTNPEELRPLFTPLDPLKRAHCFSVVPGEVSTSGRALGVQRSLPQHKGGLRGAARCLKAASWVWLF